MQIGESNAVTFEVDTERWDIPKGTLALVCIRMKLSHKVPSDPSYWHVQNDTLEVLGPYGNKTCLKGRDSYIAMAYAHTTDVSARDVSLPLYVPIVPAKTNTLKIWVTQQVVVSSIEHSDVRLFGKNTVFISGAPTEHSTCGTLSFTKRVDTDTPQGYNAGNSYGYMLRNASQSDYVTSKVPLSKGTYKLLPVGRGYLNIGIGTEAPDQNGNFNSNIAGLGFRNYASEPSSTSTGAAPLELYSRQNMPTHVGEFDTFVLNNDTNVVLHITADDAWGFFAALYIIPAEEVL